MKLHQSSIGTQNIVAGYGDDWVQVRNDRYQHPILVFPQGDVLPWPVADFDALSADHFASILAQKPEIVIVGTGKRQRFLHPRLSSILLERRIGVEAMDTGAACRTYNILLAEGRNVAAALLLP